MVGPTLAEIREHIETLASADGTYYVVCARLGERPVPVSGLRFDRRATARNAARAAEQYRTALRRYDPQVPYHDLIVSQEPPAGKERSASSPAARSCSGVSPSDGPSGGERRRLVEFCHTVAAVVFEALSDGRYDGVETAVMDAYFDLAETIPDPDDCCLCLLESMARELDERLCPAEQADVIAAAAERLPPADRPDRPVSETLTALEDRGLVGDAAQSPWTVAPDDGPRSVVVQLSEYALAPRDGRLPVLPLALELHRRRADLDAASLRAAGVDDGWQLTLVLADDAGPRGLVRAPIDPG
jgi:hypothetical protein